MKHLLRQLVLDSGRRDFLRGRSLISAASAAAITAEVSAARAAAASTDKTEELIFMSAPRKYPRWRPSRPSSRDSSTSTMKCAPWS
jgi:hypothetical protein